MPWIAALACGGVPSDVGLDALLRVEGGSFVRGAPPREGGGPNVLGTFLTQTTLRVRQQNKSFTGVLEPGASAAAIALDGDIGYWQVVAGFPLPETPDAPSFAAPLSFASELAPGPHTLRVWAADDEGVFGLPAVAAFELTPPLRPEGALVVSLSWNTESDSDLHLVTPDGTEVYKGNANSWQRAAGGPLVDDGWQSGGLLDFDSNAECRIDGRRAENIIWSAPPPAGRYRARVDTFSLCGNASARWRLEVWRDGQRLAAAEGMSLDAATRFSHGRGAGVLAVEFDVP